mgnify:FL=1
MSNLYQDQALSPEQRAQALLEELSLPEKMAQVRGIFPFGPGWDDWEAISRQTKYGIGQVSTLQMRDMATKEECCAWQRKIQEIVMGNSPHHIPAAFHMEGLCGAFIQDSLSLPSGIARGAGWDPDLEEQLGKAVSRQETACGITQTLAPVLDVAREPRMGRHGEPYGEDPTLVSSMGTAYLKGLQAGKTAGRETEGAAKHFLAFHNSQGGIHGSHSLTTPRELQEVYGKPFQAAIAKGGLKGVMPCYCLIDGEPVHASKKLITGLLREEMGFTGVTVSDYGGVAHTHEDQHVEETMEEAALRCMAAGMDVELPSEHGYSDGLEELFATGKADMAILDQAVLRVLTAKFRTGLFEHPFALAGEELNHAFFDDGDRELTLRSARESLVLLKNDGTLPIKEKKLTISLIGPHADHANKFFGGYTHMAMAESTYAVRASIAGVGQEGADGAGIQFVPGTQIQSDETPEIQAVLKRQKPGCKSLLQELRDRLPEARILYACGYPVAGEDSSGYEEALAQIAQADVAILTLGGKHGTCSIASMGEGVDATNINLPPCQEKFLRQAAALGKPLVAGHLDGRPISSDAADQCCAAILECWSPAEVGAQAICDALLGDYNPGGKLPVSVAYNAGQVPVYYAHPWGSGWHQSESIGFTDYVDCPHRPRYPFGFGLSYTSFAYAGLEISRKEVPAGENVEISFTVENTGPVPGDEVAQLYVSDVYASMTRPVKELAGFARVHLEPGEKKRLTFSLHTSQLAFLDQDMKWKIEHGEIRVEAAASSDDVRLSGSFRIDGDLWIEGKEREFWAEAAGIS